MTVKRYQKTVAVICIALIFTLCTIIPAKATYSRENEYGITSDELTEDLNADTKQLLEGLLNNSSSITDTATELELFDLCGLIIQIVKNIYPTLTKNALSLFILIIVISLLNTAKNSISTPFFSEIIEFASMIVFSVCLYSFYEETQTDTDTFIQALTAFINSLLPAMTLLYTLGGNVSSAVVNTTGIAFVSTITSTLIKNTLYPLVNVSFGLAIASKLTPNDSINHIGKTVRNLFITLFSGLITLFSIFLLFKTNLSASADGAVARTVRFAGSFIPVIGSALGESVRSVMAGLQLIKSSVGTVGIIIVIAITLPPLLKLLLTKLMVDAASIAAMLLNCSKEADLLKDLSSIIGFLLAIIFIISILFILVLTVFISISPALGGT